VNRRTFIRRVAQGAAGLGALHHLPACHSTAEPRAATGGAFPALRDRYFVKTLERNPVMSTYLGGDGASPALAGTNGRLRDLSPAAVQSELTFLRGITRELDGIDPAGLTPDDRIDRELILAQAGYVIHQLGDRATHQRSIENYASEPFRGIDWHMQQMTDAGGGMIGSEPEWRDAIARTRAVAAYLDTARVNLAAGVAAGNLPDHRMVQLDGIDAARASADYFAKALPGLAEKYLGSRPFARRALSALAEAGAAAARAYTGFAEFLSATYGGRDKADRYATGEAEYEWRVHHCLRDPRSAAQLFDYGAAQVGEYEERMFRVAAELARSAHLPVDPSRGNPVERRAAVRAVMDHLNKDSPRNDAELFAWYREAAERAVAYGRERDLFDIPAEYKLDIVETPPVLRSGGGAAYYPAAPFKKSGVGRFYLTPTDGDAALLAQQARASVADTAVHEGFPGHDWNYKYMTQHASEISRVRWLTPGSVEDCFSMWEDSMAIEGWALYAEELMAEPTPGRPYGFYDPGEYLFVLQGQLLRAVRIRVDVGIHTGRMTFDDAVDYHAEHVAFYAGARQRAASDPVARAVFEDAGRAIYRYSKWPTQAITYNLGKTAIADLRATLERDNPTFNARAFHEQFMRMGSIPVAYFRDLLVSRMKAEAAERSARR
jgi:uncharacterized protein (DUF885 family)